jgi:translation initiation factor IF-2
MAKVRVYELAKELNVDNKELIDKLAAGGIVVKNYMSTLDEDVVERAKVIMAGSVSEVVEEKRIKPTVIRRRKKTLAVEHEEGAPAEGAGEPVAQEAQPAGKAAEKEEAAPEEIEEEPAARGSEAVKGSTRFQEAEPSEEEDKSGKGRLKGKGKKGKRKKIDVPAKIIKTAEESPLKHIVAKPKVKEAAPGPVRPEMHAKIGVAVSPEEDKGQDRIDKKKKGKKRVEKEEIGSKGRIRHKKLEIFERADLYEGRRVKRKKKEGAAGEVPRKLKKTEITTPKAIKRRIKVQEQVTVAELAKVMGVKGSELIRKLMGQGVMVTVTQAIDFETASLIAEEFGYELELEQVEFEKITEELVDKPEDLAPRPPVVTIMGHVDHGKTSLLDYIRQSHIIAGESGGITQHIGAYYVERPGGDVVFLDTPGHEAFTAMRARGAKVTDIIILVVAADDGVMPQTREAINHAKAANVPIIVAVNKMDKAEANPDKVKRDLADLELVSEDWGGQTIYGYISAKTGQGVNELLELVLLQAQILELKANPNKPARGTIIEAKLDKNLGSVATVLIKNGTLKVGDQFICGECYGKVRAMLNNRGKMIKTAGPAMPVEIYGISGVPKAGDEFIVVQDEKKAKQFAEMQQSKAKAKEISKRGIISLDDLYEKIKEGEVKELNIVLKTDVQGSLEALAEALEKLSTAEVKLKIIHSSTGAITETDVMLASASNAIIIGFNVRANPRVVEIAEKEKVDIRYYDIIYNAIQDVRSAMAGLLEPKYEEEVIGRADVKEAFHIPKVGFIAGCYVTSGSIERNARVRLLREDVVVYDGKLTSLRRFKDDVKEVQTGYECGIGLENFQDIKPGDVLEVYKMNEIAAEL